MSSRRKSHRPQAASISHPILQTDGASAIGRIASPSSGAVFGQLSHAGPSASTSYAGASSSGLPLLRRSPASQTSALPAFPFNAPSTAGPSASATSPHATARSRLTPPPSQPLAPAASLTNAAGGPGSLVSPGASAAIGITSLSRSPSTNLSISGPLPEGFLSSNARMGAAAGPYSPGLADRGEYRIRVNSTDIELGTSSRPCASLTLRQAKGSGNSQRGSYAHNNSSHRFHGFPDHPRDDFVSFNKGKQRETHGLDFEVHPTFRADASYRGNVLVKVQGVDFFVHADVLRFSAPFFESLLEGGWKESRSSWRSSLFDQGGDVTANLDFAGTPNETERHSTNADEFPLQGLRAQTAAAEESNDFAELHRTAAYKNAGKQSRGAAGVRSSFVTAYTDFEDAGLSIPEWPENLPAIPSDQVDGSTEEPQEIDEMRGHGRDRSSASFASASASTGLDESAPSNETVFHGDSLAQALDRTTSAENDNPDDAESSARSRADERPTVAGTGSGTDSGREATTAGRRHVIRRSASEGSLPSLVHLAGSASLSDANEANPPAGRLNALATPPASPRLTSAVLPKKTLLESEEASSLQSHKGVSDIPTGEKQRQRPRGLKAMIELQEESASTFQNFLFYIYPHLDVQITWLSCGSLLAFADKIGAPFLHRACLDFLRASLAGKPIEAMRLAEMHRLADVYKEASRHVLDNWTAWDKEDLELLSSDTLLKLERRRSWFLERVLKLGLANPLRDYECHVSCPDPGACAKALHERWQAGYAASCRFAPPQPSGIWRYLREVDGQAPLPHSACNSAAKAWRELLFDRMFNLPSIPHGGRTVRQFLHVKLEH